MFSPTQLGYASVSSRSIYCPSVDVFFKSVDHYWQGDLVAVLLTGMGRDGVGKVVALGPGVAGVSPGAVRMILRSDVGGTRPGTFAQRVAVPVEDLAE